MKLKVRRPNTTFKWNFVSHFTASQFTNWKFVSDDDVASVDALEIEEVSVDVEVADRTTPETVEKPNTLEIQTTDSKNKS